MYIAKTQLGTVLSEVWSSQGVSHQINEAGKCVHLILFESLTLNFFECQFAISRVFIFQNFPIPEHSFLHGFWRVSYSKIELLCREKLKRIGLVAEFRAKTGRRDSGSINHLL